MDEAERDCLEGFSDESGTDAAGTDLYGRNAAVAFNSLDFLKIRIPYCTGFIVRMTDIVSEAGAFTTNLTFS
jgi:hypothetical protein